MSEKAKERVKLHYWRSQRKTREVMEGLKRCSRIIVYDLETTGINPLFHRIIELAAICLTQKNGRFIESERFHRYFRLPEGIPLPTEITELTGITSEKLEKEAYEDECLEDVQFFFEDIPVAGYNSSGFDDLFMKQYFYRNGSVFCPKASFDVLMMAHDFVPPQKVENKKLETIASFYQIQAKQYHAAYSDAEVTIGLLNQFLECYEKDESVTFHGTQRPRILRVSYWGREGQENDIDRPFHRIYVTVDSPEQNIFYDIPSGVWYTTSKDIDMDWLEMEAWKLVNAVDEDEFRDFRGKIEKK